MTRENLIARIRSVLEGRTDVRFAMLFGSAATRDPDRARDIDVGVSFKSPLGLMDLGALAVEVENVVGRDVDLVSVDDGSTVLRWEVVRSGCLIVAADQAAWLQFMARVPIEWADLRPYFERESEGLRHALEGARWSASTWSAPRSAG